jgi:hypothetical protein
MTHGNKHTRGPWSIQCSPSMECSIISKYSLPMTHVALLPPLTNKAKDEQKANALLIVAAPDLLEALEGLLKSVTEEIISQGEGYTEKGLHMLPEFKTANSAISKAKGTTS